ncbi:MAG: RnfABCDGE type electron transport complex subunit D [Clostridia bacterium]|nr:RnfABCDGE type electron transport complex subunit D [Clostridia bacterium]
MPQNNTLIYSSSPHIRSKITTKKIMQDVCIALIPATIMGIVLFGLKALLLIFLSCFTAVASEIIFNLINKKTFIQCVKEFDYSSLVSGLLLGLTVGTNYPWYTVIFGSIFSIIVVKMLFGGTGKNLVNPAITGRIFIFISFQSVVGAWVLPNVNSIFTNNISTGATVIESLIKNGNKNLSSLDLLLGSRVPGCIGETCKLAIWAGAIYLAVKKIINITYPLIYIVVEGIFAVALKGFDFSYFLPSILSGGLIFGAFFMATDYTTSPDTKTANIIYFICLGLITAGLREATKMEATSFAILLMNLTVPLFDKFIINKPFGYQKQKKIKGGEKHE